MSGGSGGGLSSLVSETEPDITVSTSGGVGYINFDSGSINRNDFTGTLSVANGGTGLSTATTDALIKGAGTSAMVSTGIAVDSSNGISGHTETQNVQTGTTYTMTAGDSGKVVIFTNGSAVTVTVPQTLTAGWHCRWEQQGAGKVSFNGTAVTAATLRNRQSHVASAGQYAVGGLACYTTGTPAVVSLFGDTGT